MAFFSDTRAADARPAFFSTKTNSVMAVLAKFADAQNCTRTVQALRNRSDRELADIGIAREEIVRHVYNDIYNV